MCGILWLENKRGQSAVKPLLKRYHKQENRGTDGFGYVTVAKDGTVSKVFRATEEKDMIAAIVQEENHAILLHHRFPTSLPNYIGATHPLVISDDRFKFNYYVLHNGVISNAVGIYDDLKKENYKFLTEMVEGGYHEFIHTGEKYITDEKTKINDSEAFAYDLVMNIEGMKTYLRSAGTVSFIALQVDKKANKLKNVIYGHNSGNPLVLEEDKSIFCLKSLGHGKDVDTGKFYFREFGTDRVTSKEVNGFTYGWGRERQTGYNTRKDKDIDAGPDYSNWAQGYGGDDDDDLDKAMTRLLPAGHVLNVPPPHAPRKTDWHGGKKKDDLVDYNLDDLPVIDIEDLGFPDDIIDYEIAAQDAQNGDGGVIRELRDDLRSAIAAENEAAEEMNAAKSMLRDLATHEAQLAELEEAKALFDTAEKEWRKARLSRNSVEAELSAWVSKGPPEDRFD